MGKHPISRRHCVNLSRKKGGEGVGMLFEGFFVEIHVVLEGAPPRVIQHSVLYSKNLTFLKGFF